MVWTPNTRYEYARNHIGYASDMTDSEWRVIVHLLPASAKTGRPRRHPVRVLVNGIYYLLQSGCQWRMLPKDFPPWQTVYRYFRRWETDGVWARIHDVLVCRTRELAGRSAPPSFAIMDSQSSKTGPDACEMVGFDAGKKVKGRKRHIVVDTLGLILKAVVHGANVQDRDGVALVCANLTKHFPSIEKICADGGYRGPIAQRNSPRPLEIIKRSQAGFEVLPKRWIVERTFAWLGINRRLSKDFERFAKTSKTFVHIAMIKLMSRRLAKKSTL